MAAAVTTAKSVETPPDPGPITMSPERYCPALIICELEVGIIVCPELTGIVPVVIPPLIYAVLP